MKKLLPSLLMTLALIYAPLLRSGEDNGERRSCAEIKKQIKGLEKEKETLAGQKAALDTEFGKARDKFETYRSKLASQSGCSKGNPNNSSSCEEILKGLEASGAEMNRADEQKKSVGQQITALESQLVQPQAEWTAYSCK